MFVSNKYFFNIKTLLFLVLSISLFSACSSHKSYNHRSKRTQRYSKRTYVKKTRVKKYETKKNSSEYRLRKQLLGTAKKYIGTEYVYGGKNPKGFDCSGFVTWVMNKNGVNMTGSSRTIAKMGTKKDLKKLKTGDLVFFGSGSKVSHIAIVVENNKTLKVIHSTSSRGVVIDEITNSEYWKKRYLFGKSVI